MTCITRAPVATDLSERPLKKRFRSTFGTAKASPEVVSRQAQITLLAFRAHHHRDAALAFLNEHSDALDGRPLDIAGKTDAGLAAATSLLETQIAAGSAHP